MSQSKLKKSIARRHGTVWEVFTMAGYIFGLVAQLVFFMTIYIMFIFLVASGEMEPGTRRLYGTVAFVVTIAFTGAFGFYWLWSVMSLSENARQERESNGRFQKPQAPIRENVKETIATITSNGGKKVDYLIDGKAVEKRKIDEYISRVGG